MPLAGYKPETREVPLDGKTTVTIRGLSLSDFSVLIREHFPDLDALFDLFGSMEDMTAEQFTPLALMLVSNAPGFVANVIALAAGEGSAEDASLIPGPTQAKIFVAVCELTFTEVGGLGKAVETVAALLKNPKASKMLTKTRKVRAG